MTDLGQTKKVCANGHVMDPAWAVCPYCPSERRASPPLAKTVRIDDVGKAAPPSSAARQRKTEVMNKPPLVGGVAWLVGFQGTNKGKIHRIDGERVTVGASSGCDLVVDHPHVSDRHASLRFQDREFVVTDLDSTNGTYVNGDQVTQHTLTDGDRLGLGSSEWVFKCVLFENE